MIAHNRHDHDEDGGELNRWLESSPHILFLIYFLFISIQHAAISSQKAKNNGNY